MAPADSAPPPRHRLGPRFLGRLLGLSLLPAAPAWAVDLPRGGVVCDRVQRVCYDATGPSLRETRRRYGSDAERNLVRRLSGRPPMREVLFSSGELCDFRSRECWDDGNRRSNVSHRLNRHLFGGSGGISSVGDRRCELRRSGRSLFSGTCRFRRVEDPDDRYDREEGIRRAYLVETGDGRRYRFHHRSGRLWLRDGTGTWPVSASERSDELVFRWADLQLAVERRRSGVLSPYPFTTPRTSEQQLIENLFDSLFR